MSGAVEGQMPVEVLQKKKKKKKKKISVCR